MISGLYPRSGPTHGLIYRKLLSLKSLRLDFICILWSFEKISAVLFHLIAFRIKIKSSRKEHLIRSQKPSRLNLPSCRFQTGMSRNYSSFPVERVPKKQAMSRGRNKVQFNGWWEKAVCKIHEEVSYVSFEMATWNFKSLGFGILDEERKWELSHWLLSNFFILRRNGCLLFLITLGIGEKTFVSSWRMLFLLL